MATRTAKSTPRARPKPGAGPKSRPLAKSRQMAKPAAHARSLPARRVPRAVFLDGNLRQALIDAAVELAREGSPARVTVREAGRRAGVSPAASARHFASNAALLGAVAAEALRRFSSEMQCALAGVTGDDPVERLRAIGHAFIRWALHSPTHFRILSARDLIGFAQVPELRDELQDMVDGVMSLSAEAQRRGQWPAGSTRLFALASRALVYGLSRMKADGQLPQWGVGEEETEATLLDVVDLYIDMLSRAARAPRGR